MASLRAQSPFHINGELLSIVLDALPLDELVRSSGCRGCSRGWRAATAAAADGRIRRWPVLASLIQLMEYSSFTAAEGDDEGASEEDTSRLHFWLSDGVGTRAALLRGTEALLRDAAGEVNISGAQVPWDARSWPLVRLHGVYNGCKGVIQLDLRLVPDQRIGSSQGSMRVMTDTVTSWFVDHVADHRKVVLGALGHPRCAAQPPRKRGLNGAAALAAGGGGESADGDAHGLGLLRVMSAPGGALSLPYSMNDWVEASHPPEALPSDLGLGLGAALVGPSSHGCLPPAADAAGTAARAGDGALRWRWHTIRPNALSNAAARSRLEHRFARACARALGSIGCALAAGREEATLGLARRPDVPPPLGAAAVAAAVGSEDEGEGAGEGGGGAAVDHGAQLLPHRNSMAALSYLALAAARALETVEAGAGPEAGAPKRASQAACDGGGRQRRRLCILGEVDAAPSGRSAFETCRADAASLCGLAAELRAASAAGCALSAPGDACSDADAVRDAVPLAGGGVGGCDGSGCFPRALAMIGACGHSVTAAVKRVH